MGATRYSVGYEERTVSTLTFPSGREAALREAEEYTRVRRIRSVRVYASKTQRLGTVIWLWSRAEGYAPWNAKPIGRP